MNDFYISHNQLFATFELYTYLKITMVQVIIKLIWFCIGIIALIKTILI